MARVLVVEPDRRIRKFVAGILAEFGHHVEACGDAREARRSLGRARFDVLATDLVLARDRAGDFVALAPDLPLLTLRGQPFRAAADRAERPGRLRDTPFRFADLAALVAAVGAPRPVHPRTVSAA
ncbi:MAG TPA: hypothetical protein VJR70_04190 [Stellaceae bacterium]|nr:hypothetical protein [Stellaceae bacterium]